MMNENVTQQDGAPDDAAVRPSASVPGRARFGVNAKLQIAFGAAAVLTVIASAVAIVSFSVTERGFDRIKQHEVPVMTDALRLSAISGEISTAAARFVNTRTAAEQALISSTIAAKKGQLAEIMERLRSGRGSSAAFARVDEISQRLSANLGELARAISERTRLRDWANSSRRSSMIPISTLSSPPRMSARARTKQSSRWSRTGSS